MKLDPFAPVTFSTLVHRYTVSMIMSNGKPLTVFTNVPRWRAAEALRTARKYGDTLTITHTATYSESVEESCFGCQARQRMWDNDCDGPYQTATCDSAQCNWAVASDARDAREARETHLLARQYA